MKESNNFSDMIDWILQHLECHTAYYVVAVFGLIPFLKLTLTSLHILYLHIVPNSLSLTDKYGKDSWALVTGSSEGIGLGFARQIARRGMNVLLMSRTESKLKQAQEEIQKLAPSVKVEYIVCDLGKQGQKEDIQAILPQLDRYDISVLVNNAGTDLVGPSHQLPIEHIFRIVQLNCFAFNAVIYKLAPKMLKRNHKGAIINISSMAAELENSRFGYYGATKAHQLLLTQDLKLEYPQIDWLAIQPGIVSTALAGNRRVDYVSTIDIDQCAQGSLKALTRKTESYGHFVHQLHGLLMIHLLPKWVSAAIWKYVLGPMQAKLKQAQAKSQASK